MNTQGRTMEEAREMLADAVALMVEGYREDAREFAGPNALREKITFRI